MESNKLNRNRSISDVTVDTIKFMRDNFKPLFKSLRYIAGVPILLLTLITVYLEHTAQFDPALGLSSGMLLGFLLQLMLSYIVYLVGIIYVKLHYKQGAGNFDPVSDVFSEAKRFGVPFIGLMILVTISYIGGIVLFLLPGIYLIVALFTAGFVLVIEEESVDRAYSRSMNLVKGYWWHTFGAIALLWVVIFGVSLFLGLPSLIAGFLFGVGDALGSNLLSESTLLLLAVVNYVFKVIHYFFSVISGIGAAMIYFSLREKKEGTSLSREIAEL